MPLTLEQIIEETRDWPLDKVDELIDRLTETLHFINPGTDTAWNTEINRRIEEIQNGKVQGIPAEEVLARIHKIVGLGSHSDKSKTG